MEVKRMADTKTTIYYNHNFYYDFSKIISADAEDIQKKLAEVGSKFELK